MISTSVILAKLKMALHVHWTGDCSIAIYSDVARKKPIVLCTIQPKSKEVDVTRIFYASDSTVADTHTGRIAMSVSLATMVMTEQTTTPEA